jgi:uncharacterized membrane protein YdcZ (DUF606 family)
VGLYAAGLFLLANTVLLWWPAEDAGLLFKEDGRLELVQVGLLVLMLALMIDAARRLPATRPLSVLLAGVAVAALVREHNNWFKDEIGRGVWQAVVGVVLVVTALVAKRLGGDVRAGIADLVARPAFGWLAGGVVIFAYGQVLDELPIWQLLLGKDVPYAAQRMAEECVETASYWLLAAGLFEWWLTAPRQSEALGP